MKRFIMLVGLPGSGKSTYAQKCKCKIVCPDSIREEITGDESNMTMDKEVFSLVKERLTILLNPIIIGDVVYDATNITEHTRSDILRLCPDSVRKIAVVFNPDLEMCLRQNAQRERKVPEHVIKNMFERYEPISLEEGFDEIVYM